MTDPPYPASAAAMLHDRVHRIEGRVDYHDQVLGGILTSQAVTTEQVKDLKDDIRDLIDAIGTANSRVSGILRAVWGLVLVLIPVAVGIFAMVVQRGGG